MMVRKTENTAKALDLLAVLESKRAAIDDIKAELDWLVAAPVTPADLRARVKSHVDSLAASYIASAPTGTIAAPQSGIEAVRNFLNHGTIEAGYGRPLVSEMLAFAMGDALVERICAAVESMGIACGPALHERRARIETLKQELFALEVEEERIIETAEENRVSVARRVDADPAAVLGFDPQGNMPLLITGRVGGPGFAIQQ